MAAGDFVPGDRGCFTGRGIAHVASCGGHVTVRASTGSLGFVRREDGSPFGLLKALSSLTHPGKTGSWNVTTAGDEPVDGRVRAIRKSEEAVRQPRGRIRRKASRAGMVPKP